jgi:hypothetical protein
VIVLDTDILIIDLQFQRDIRFADNRRLLDHARLAALPMAITCQTLLEVVGKYSFHVRQSDISKLAAKVPIQYGVRVLPDPSTNPEYASCTVGEVVAQMTQRMGLGDAVNAVQIAKFAAGATCLLTWNARHYQGKLVVPVQTPEEWLRQNLPLPPQSPAGP